MNLMNLSVDVLKKKPRCQTLLEKDQWPSEISVSRDLF